MTKPGNASRRSALVLAMALACVAGLEISARAQTEQVLYNFGAGGSGDALTPYASLVMDASGNLFGTTVNDGAFGLGTVFELAKSSGTYTEKVLYSFGTNGSLGSSGTTDGANPYAGLIMDAAGNLYGTTEYGGAFARGAVFELANSSGAYTETVLYSFGTNGAADGLRPYAGLIMDAAGNLYGTTIFGGSCSSIACASAGAGAGTSNLGTVFELVNSSAGYSEKVLYSFGTNGTTDGVNPYAGLIMDGAGNLFGTTELGGASAKGTVFELVNSSGGYTERVLYSFGTNGGTDGANPYAGLIMDAAGNLYGTTEFGGGCSSIACATSGAGGIQNWGTVFELVNSPGGYTERVLYSFGSTTTDGAKPSAGLIMDAAGNLYGTTIGLSATSGAGAGGGRTVFELVNSSGTFTEYVLHAFGSLVPYAGLIMDAAGNLYGTTLNGSTASGTVAGTVFEFSGCQSTTLLSSSPNPATAGQSIVLSATVSVPASCQGTQGVVQFFNGSTSLGTATVSATPGVPNTTASITVEDAELLGIGTFNLAAQFTPTAALNTFSSGTLLQTVTEFGIAATSGNNTFFGNQTVNGTLSATSLFGNGGGLTNLNPAFLSPGTAGINITGNAATATAATTAAFATAAGNANTASAANVAASLTGPTTQCGANNFSVGIAANGNANCQQPTSGNLSDGNSLVRTTQLVFSSAGQSVRPAWFIGAGTDPVEGHIQQIMAFGGHITAIACFSQVAPKGGSNAYTLRKNGINTIAVCKVAAASTTGTTTNLSVPFAVGDLLDFQTSGPLNSPASIAIAITP